MGEANRKEQDKERATSVKRKKGWMGRAEMEEQGKE